MSGIEIAGIVIAIIGLIKDARDYSADSDSLLRKTVFLGEEGFAAEVRSLSSSFNTQKAIFRARSVILLSTIEPDPKGMIHRIHHHPQPEDHTQSTLVDLSLRVKLVWGQSKIKQKIARFEELNKVFRMLTNEIVKLLTDDKNCQARKDNSKKSLATSNQRSKLRAYRNIQHASLALYKAISEKWCCSAHEKHVVRLSSVRELEQYATNCPVSFMAMITGIDNDPVYLHNLKLEVQHGQSKTGAGNIGSHAVGNSGKTIGALSKDQVSKPESCSRTPSLEYLSSSLQKNIQGVVPETTNCERMKDKKRPKFRYMQNNIPLQHLTLDDSSGEPHDMQDTYDSITDLQYISDHCDHLREKGRNSSGKDCLGYFANECIVRFYMRHILEQDIDEQPRSLAELIRSTSENALIKAFPCSHVMGLASSIADAVLQFYSSPWLPEQWNSNYFHFFKTVELNEMEATFQTRPLYVSLDFGKASKGKGIASGDRKPLGEHISNTSQSFGMGIRNERLFCLGIVFLELGYTMPWSSLRSSIIESFPTHPDSNYLIAETLAGRLVSQMGLGYVRVVRKCIGCDFGLGETNLDVEELQKKFLEDVIEALRALEEVLSTL
ncbi:hypothetical protein F4805DRAFT_478845 [Annulohypoxylon moriforme]|nr:hypothetical protein F4805DRAFT_478845 [Annulohypoxylon moriforme]